MKNLRKIPALILVLILMLSLCACGTARKSTLGVSSAKASSPTFAANTAAYGEVYDDGYAYEAAEAEYDRAAGFSSVSSSAAPKPEAQKENGSDEPEETPDKIIYSADVTVETTEFDETVGKVSELVETYFGWVESSSISGSNYYQKSRGNASTRSASYTLRIPSSRFSEAMDSLSSLGNVPYSHIYTENVTSQYYDAQARLKAYQTQETRLLEMMELAESVEDVIIIEDRLTELRYRIESIQSNLKNWDRRVSYSTVYLTVQEVREYTPEEKVNPTYGEELLKALKDGLKNAGDFLKDLLVFIVEVLPVLVILVPVVWLVIRLLRRLYRWGKGRREKHAETKAQKKSKKTEKEPAATAAVLKEAGQDTVSAKEKKETEERE